MKKNKLEYYFDNTFTFNDFIIKDPYLDETGRFEVDPLKYYGVDEEWLKEFNKEVHHAHLLPLKKEKAK